MCGSSTTASVGNSVIGLFGGGRTDRSGTLVKDPETPAAPRFQPMQDARRMIQQHQSILAREQDRRGSTVLTSGIGQVDIRRQSLLGVTQ